MALSSLMAERLNWAVLRGGPFISGRRRDAAEKGAIR